MTKIYDFPCQGCGACDSCVSRAVKEQIVPPCAQAAAAKAGAKTTPYYPTVLREDEKDMSVYCARLMKKVLEEKPDALFCLAAGKTATETYKEFIRMVEAGEVDASRARFVSLDEWGRLSPEARKEDCFHFMLELIYGPLKLTPDRLTVFDSTAADLREECRRIDAVIDANGGVDFMLLGLGMNGHLGLNEPGADFHDHSHVTSLSETTKTVGQKYFSAPTVLTDGITTGIAHMFEAKQVVLQVCGAHKREIIRQMYTSPVTQEIPGTVFQVLPQGLVVLDKDSAQDIQDIL